LIGVTQKAPHAPTGSHCRQLLHSDLDSARLNRKRSLGLGNVIVTGTDFRRCLPMPSINSDTISHLVKLIIAIGQHVAHHVVAASYLQACPHIVDIHRHH
jgi:hypothetical protein